ncbi:pilus assembly protein PilZ [Bacillus aerolatus]|uniref:Pilus assembly protein PilZ n=1 Tax=Bacillus aerolatus TaxID=2653354 RepID=A0A6I1FVE9_9BACI|nr:PilZ domain-containing protein [Bacillus aerolatus]KAB7708893.1 pilus assembly protein PilZ [Bacillus aerolatus]
MIEMGMYLLLVSTDAEGEEERYRCRVADIDEGHILIDYPVKIKTNRSTFFVDGMQLSAEFIDPKSSSAVYTFNTEVIGRTKREIPLLLLHDPGKDKYERIQRRKFVRLQSPVNAAIYLNNKPPFTAATEDISAGGIAIALPEGVEAEYGDSGRVFLSVPMQSSEHHYFEIAGKVVRTRTDHTNRTIVSIEFTDLREHEQQVLLRFCFECQLMMKRKGLVQ